MAFEHEKRVARRIIAGIEDAKLSTTDIFHLVQDADPTLVYFIFAWIRAWYPATHPAADAVLGRLLDLCKQHPKASRLAKEGESDALVAWFEEDYKYRDFRADAFVDLIIEKLEG